MAEVVDLKSEVLETEPITGDVLSPLPFTYVRANDREKASIVIFRKPIFGPPRTDEDVLRKAVEEKKNQEWFTADRWREKGTPREQIEFSIGSKKITLYNYSSEKPFTDNHTERASRMLGDLAAHFPEILDKLDWILVDDKQPTGTLGDDEKYPTNGYCQEAWRAFYLYPRGMDFSPHRIKTVTNLEGTLAHELSHIFEPKMKDVWEERFRWEHCSEHPDKFERRVAPNGELKFFERPTGEIYPMGWFPLQPEQCVNQYARFSAREDRAESMTAYLYDPDLLRSVSPEKYQVIEGYDAKLSKPEVRASRIPKDQIVLPEIKPKTVYYFVREPSAPQEKELNTVVITSEDL